MFMAGRTAEVVVRLADHNVIEYYTRLSVSGKPWRVTSPYGYRKDPWGSGATVFHPGIDFGDRPAGDPIRAPFPGVVTASAAQVNRKGQYAGAGNYVAVKIDGHPIIMLFFHLQSRAVKVGQRVDVGTIIGYNGVTGNATGAHLHFELRHALGSPTGNGVWGDPAEFRIAAPARSTTFKPGNVLQTTATASLNFRAAPGTEGTIIGSLENGTVVTVLEHSSNGIHANGHHWWYVALIDNQKGWLAESYIEFISGGAQAELERKLAEAKAEYEILKNRIIQAVEILQG